MDRDRDRDDDAIRQVQARRISTGDPPAATVEEVVGVVAEVPLTIDVEGVEHFVLLCTPVDRQALVVGFLFSEGVIDDLSDIAALKPCDDDPNTVRVRLAGGAAPRVADAGRNLLIVSACGACGTEDLQAKLAALPRVGDTLRIDTAVLRAVGRGLCEGQPLFEASGATHAVGIFDREGRMLACAEDTGRHNALDKAVGKCLLAGISTAGRGAMLSGRVSLEMVTKCARAGIELITAISAPTSLALELAERCNITLCGFVRETRATIFTHGDRLRPLTR
jgi:FdhD protein